MISARNELASQEATYAEVGLISATLLLFGAAMVCWYIVCGAVYPCIIVALRREKIILIPNVGIQS